MKEIAYLHNFETTDKHGNTLFVDIFIFRENGNTETHVFEPNRDLESDEDFETAEIDAWLEEARFIPISEHDESIAITIGQSQIVIRNILRGTYGPVPIPNEPYMANDEDMLTERDELQFQYFNAVLAYELQNLVVNQCLPMTNKPQ